MFGQSFFFVYGILVLASLPALYWFRRSRELYYARQIMSADEFANFAIEHSKEPFRVSMPELLTLAFGLILLLIGLVAGMEA